MPKASKNKTAPEHFIVMEMATEYNDEIEQIQDGGTPVKVFANREDAEKDMRQRLIERLKGLQVGCYAYDANDIISPRMSEEDVVAKLPFCDLSEGDFNEWTLPEKLTDEQWDLVISCFSRLELFSIVEV
jgi:hypothetical protein